MAKLMRGEAKAVQSGNKEFFIDHFLYATDADPAVITADKKRHSISGLYALGITHSEVIVDGFTAAFRKVYHTFFIAFTDLIDMLSEMSRIKTDYDRLAAALRSVRESGYGVVMPMADQMTLEEPQIVRQGGKYTVRLKVCNPEELVLARERTEELYSELAQCLSRMEKQVLSLYREGYSYREIAAHLGKEEKSIDNAVQRIRRKLARNPIFGEIS